MAHTFDTGLARTLRYTVRTFVLDTLDRLRYRATPVPSGYLKALIPHSTDVRGSNDEVGIDILFEALNGRAPAVAVVVGDKSYEPAGAQHRYMATLDVKVYVQSHNSRSMLARDEGGAEAQLSDLKDPGIEVIMEHIEELLIGAKHSSDHIKDLRPQREEEIASTKELTLWMMTFQVKVTRSTDWKRDLTEYLTSIHVDHFARRTEDDTFVQVNETITEGLGP